MIVPMDFRSPVYELIPNQENEGDCHKHHYIMFVILIIVVIVVSLAGFFILTDIYGRKCDGFIVYDTSGYVSPDSVPIYYEYFGISNNGKSKKRKNDTQKSNNHKNNIQFKVREVMFSIPPDTVAIYTNQYLSYCNDTLNDETGICLLKHPDATNVCTGTLIVVWWNGSWDLVIYAKIVE